MLIKNGDIVKVRLKSLTGYGMDCVTTHKLIIGNTYDAKYQCKCNENDWFNIDNWKIHPDDVEIVEEKQQFSVEEAVQMTIQCEISYDWRMDDNNKWKASLFDKEKLCYQHASGKNAWEAIQKVHKLVHKNNKISLDD